MLKLTEDRSRPSLPMPQPVDTHEEVVWKAWLAKGRAGDLRGSANRIQALKLALIALLLVMAWFGAKSVHYDIVPRLIVAAGAFMLMVQAFRVQSYTFAGAFGLMALLFNPAVPVFSAAGAFQRTLILATTVPLILSFRWDKPKQATL